MSSKFYIRHTVEILCENTYHRPRHKMSNAAFQTAVTLRLRPPPIANNRPLVMCAPQTCRLITWNVCSLRSLLRKDPSSLTALVAEHDPDILCLQETRLQRHHEALFADALPGYTATFSTSSLRAGYAGTATFSKTPPREVGTEVGHSAEQEGRVVETAFRGAVVLNVYTVNSGAGLKFSEKRASWDRAFRKHIRALRREGLPVFVAGDLNVARGADDVFDEARVEGKPGATVQEREGVAALLETATLVDCWRERGAGPGFTFWDYRMGGRPGGCGWRIDYVLVGDELRGAVRRAEVLGVGGSDHAPMLVEFAGRYFE